MARIVKAELRMVDLKPLTQRTDAIQSFVSQETPILTLTDADGATGTGYTYTIGSGGASIVALLRHHLLPRLIGMDAEQLESNWRALLYGMHALAVGPVSSLSLAAIDIAAWLSTAGPPPPTLVRHFRASKRGWRSVCRWSSALRYSWGPTETRATPI